MAKQHETPTHWDGVQGLSDTYMMLKMPYESDEAKELNKQIFENDLLLRDGDVNGNITEESGDD